MHVRRDERTGLKIQRQGQERTEADAEITSYVTRRGKEAFKIGGPKLLPRKCAAPTHTLSDKKELKKKSVGGKMKGQGTSEVASRVALN